MNSSLPQSPDKAVTQRLHAGNGATGRLLLPAATQGIVNLHQGKHLIQPRLGKTQLVGQVIGFIGQDFEVSGRATIVTHVRQPRGVLRGGGQEFLLFSRLAGLLVGHQSVRNISERTLDRLLVRQQGLLLLCFRQPDIGLQLAGGEERLGDGSGKIPSAGRLS